MSSRKAQNAARRAAEQLERMRRLEAARRRRRLVAVGSIATVLVAVAAVVLVRVIGGGPAPAPQASADPAAAQVVAAVTAVPDTVLNQVGKGSGVSLTPKPITGQPALTADGKPLTVYIGAEYCPFCAAQRWGLIVALSRFGHFSGLTTTASASDDVYPNTATLSFHGATYTSDYLTFEGVETQSNVKQGGQYAPLDTPTAQQQQLLQTYDAPPYVPASSAGSIPFIDLGNRYLASGASVSPELLAGKSASQIAQALSNPDDPIAKAVLGSANAFTTALCQLTGGKPAPVCTAAAATAYQGALSAN